MLREASYRPSYDDAHIASQSAHAAQSIDDPSMDEVAAREVDAMTDEEPSEIDDESLYDFETSPADGYFGRRPHPRELFIANPAVASQAESEAKDREAKEERIRNPSAGPAAATTPPNSSPLTQPAPVWSTQDVPVLDAGPAPPDYAAATADRAHDRAPSQHSSPSSPQSAASHPYIRYGTLGPDSTSNSDDHQTRFSYQQDSSGNDMYFGPSEGPFSQSGVFGRNGLFQNPSQPQSMSDPPSAAYDARPDEETGLLIVREERAPRPHHGVRRKSRRSCWLRCCCNLLTIANVILAALVVLVIFFVIITASAARQRGHEMTPGGSDSPINDGNSGSGDYAGGSPVVIPFPDAPDSSWHHSTRQCPLAHISETSTFIFSSPESFSFVEAVTTSDQRFKLRSVGGQIVVLPAQSAFDGNIRVNISIATASPWLPIGISTKDDRGSLLLKTPILERSSDSSDLVILSSKKDDTRPCINIAVTIEVQQGLTLHDWKIATRFLDINVNESLFDDNTDPRYHDSEDMDSSSSSYFYITDTSRLSSEVGHVHLSQWASRDTDITTTTGDISGAFALYDSLSIHTQTGAVQLDVRPKIADPKNPKAAKFSVDSVTGNIDVRFPEAADPNLPFREYRSRITGQTSSVGGNYILGAQTEFELRTGSLQAQLLPVPAIYSPEDDDRFAKSDYDEDNDDDYDNDDERGRLDLDVRTFSGSVGLTVLPIYRANRNRLASHTESSRSGSRKWPSSSSTWHNSRHFITSTTGSLGLTYPEEWTGGIEAKTVTASINVRGRDVRITDRADIPGRHRVAAVKRWRENCDNAHVAFETHSGSVNLLMGDDS